MSSLLYRFAPTLAIVAIAAFSLPLAALFAQQPAPAADSPTAEPNAERSPMPPRPVRQRVPPPRTQYMGRQIPPYMSHLGAGWLTRTEREQEENAEQMLKRLGVEPGMTVCDLGCGNGYHTLKLARLVGPEGKVLAVDVQAEMLRLLEARAAKEELKNVELIHGLIHDPRLPEGKLDRVLLVDVYHEFSHPEQMLAAIRRSLKPEGRLVLVEFRLEDPKVAIKLLHKMSKAQVNKELTANGFKLVEEFDGLPIQHMLFFARDDDWRK